MNRRDFGRALSVAALASPFSQAAKPARIAAHRPSDPVGYVKAVFSYPPTSRLREESYYSWPGSSFDAEGRQKEYTAALLRIAGELNLRLEIEPRPLDTMEDAERFIAAARDARPDGLLLIPFKKSHWPAVVRVVEETRRPTIVMATLGVVLVEHINQLHRAPGVYLINSLEDFEAVGFGLRLIRTARWMNDSRLLNIAGQTGPDCRPQTF